MQRLGNSTCFGGIRSFYHRGNTLVRSSGLGNDIAHETNDKYGEYELNQVTVKSGKIAQRHGICDNKMTTQGQNNQRGYIGCECDNRYKARKKTNYSQTQIPCLGVGL